MNIDNSRAADLMVKFSEELSNLSQDKKIDYTNQFILNLMDYTEQSDDEHVWCELYKKFQEIIKNMNTNNELIKPIVENYLKDNPVRPHDVKLVITFKDDNTTSEKLISWETISSLKALHNVNAISEIYESSI